jgi:hypothetical protein
MRYLPLTALLVATFASGTAWAERLTCASGVSITPTSDQRQTLTRSYTSPTTVSITLNDTQLGKVRRTYASVSSNTASIASSELTGQLAGDFICIVVHNTTNLIELPVERR